MATHFISKTFHLPVEMATNLENLIKGRQFFLKQDISTSSVVRDLLEEYLKASDSELKEYQKFWGRFEKEIEKIRKGGSTNKTDNAVEIQNED